ncbi:MAG: lipoyl domain-containing protein [Caulobacterales bacterium]
MIYTLTVPGPIEDVEEVRVLEWHARVGHAFAPGDLMVELETYKALIEVRAGQLGLLRAIVCAEGDWQALGQPLALLSDGPDEPLPDTAEGLAMLAVDFEVS